MTLFTGVVVYLLLWWTVLFAILPIGVRPDAEGSAESGGWRGTPAKPHLLRKAIATTVVSAILWIGFYALVESEWLSFRTGLFAMPGS
jgi:predicted secreted protein